MTRFLPARIFSVFVFSYGCCAVRLDLRASPSEVQMDIPGVEEDRTGCEEVARVLKSHFGMWQETRTASCHAARDDAARVSFFIRAARFFGLIPSFFLSFSSLDSTSPLLALLLISCYLGLRLTNRSRLRALRVSTFPSLPFFFFSVLNGRNVLIGLFSFLCLFVFFSRSRTLIDDPSSPTRPTSKHLSISILLFSFKRSDWLFPFCALCFFLCARAFIFTPYSVFCDV